MNYKQVFIKTEADLPKDGKYICKEKNNCLPIREEVFINGIHDDYWVQYFDWYLQPTPDVSQELLDAYEELVDYLISRIEKGFDYKIDTIIVNKLQEKLFALKSKEVQPSEGVEEKQKYVCGFLFTNDCNRVILIRKNKPKWQEGMLNGVGGKIELNESPLNAMIREFKEEAGVVYREWDNFLTVEYKTSIVYFFKGFNERSFCQAETKESEIIEKIFIKEFPANEVIPNLNWIINLALDSEIEHTECVEELTSQLPRSEPKEEVKGVEDLIQYVTNLLYAAHEVNETPFNSSRFDKWVEEQTENLSHYFASLPAKQSEPRNEQLTCPHTYHTKSGYCKYCGLYNADKNIL